MTIDEQIQLLCGLPAVTVESEETPADQDIYFSVKPAASGSTGIMMSTLWNQSGIARVGDNTTIAYNEYNPFLPGTQKHGLTGCTNTAAGQIIYYFIEKGDLDLQLTLNADDAYTDDYGLQIKADGSTPGTISFAAINSKLAQYDLNSADDAAALVYACAVIQEASYKDGATSTAWRPELFYRAGFECVTVTRLYWNTKPYWGVEGNISDAGFEVLIENLTAGRVVGTSYPGHALVIDGYDAATDKFHINFGWGNSDATRWYTRAEMNKQGYYDFFYDLMVEGEKEFFVTDDRVYGTGTFLRAIELADGTKGENIITVDDALSGKKVSYQVSLDIEEKITFRNFNMDITVTKDGYTNGFCGSAGSIAEFEDFSGKIAVTGSAYNRAFYFYNAEQLTFEGNGAVVYAGCYQQNGSYESGAEAVLDSLSASQKNNSAVETFILDSTYSCYSFYGTDGNDIITLDNKTIVVGEIFLAGGNDTLSLSNNSRFYGDISCGSGNYVITIDSTSSAAGCFYGQGDLNFILTETPDNEAIFVIENNVYNLRSNATISVDLSDAAAGTYALIEADESASNLNSLNSIKITIKGDGIPSYTLSISGTSDCDYAELQRVDNTLVLRVKGFDSGDKQPPSIPSGLTAAVYGNSVRLDWQKSTDNNNVDGYYVRYGTTSSLSGEGTFVSECEMLFNGLANGVWYYQVRAQDGSGNLSAWSTVKSFTVAYVDKPVTVSSGGLLVSSAALMTGKQLSDAVMAISNGGSALRTTLLNGAVQTVFSGGVASDTKVSSGGQLNVSAYGNVKSATIYDGGSGVLYSCGSASNVIVSNGGVMTVSKGGYASNVEIKEGGSLGLNTSGSAASVKVSSGGTVGGFTLQDAVTSFSTLTISSLNIQNAVVQSGNRGYVYSGARVSNADVAAGGSLTIYSGGSVSLKFNPWQGRVYSSSGARVTYLSADAKVYYGGSAYGVLSSGNALNALSLTSGQELYVYSGGSAGSVGIGSGGKVVNSGGSVVRAAVNSLGTLVQSQGKLVSTVVNSGGILYLSGGSAQATCLSGGTMFVQSGANGGDVKISSGGTMFVRSGANGGNVELNSGGSIYISSGASLESALVNSYGLITVSSGTSVGTLELPDYGSGYIYGYVSSALVGSRTSLRSFSGCRIDNVHIASAGRFYLNGVIDSNITMERGGVLVLANACSAQCNITVNGTLRTEVLSVYTLNMQNYQLTLDLRERFVSDAYCVDDMSNISNARWGITVSSTQASGVYEIARGASGFEGTITVTCNSLSGTLRVGGSLTLGQSTYSLTVNSSGVMQLTIDNSGTEKTPVIDDYVPGTWSTDWEQASRYARENNKLIFACWGDKNFCGAAGSMEQNLLTDPEFMAFAKDNLVLLYDTLPAGKTYGGSPATRILDAQGNTLASKSGFLVSYYEAYMTWLKAYTGTLSGIRLIGSGNSVTSYTTVSGMLFTDSLYVGDATASQFKVVSSANSRGSAVIASGGTAVGASVYSGGVIDLLANGTANDTFIDQGGWMTVYDGGTADRTTVNNSGTIYISNGGTANSTTLNQGGRMRVSSGGIANETVINSGGYIYATGGSANGIEVRNGGRLYVSEGGVASAVELSEAEGILQLYSGGTVSGLTIASGAKAYLRPGTEVTGINAASGAILGFDVAPDTYFQGTYAGKAFEQKSGILSNYDIHSGCHVSVCSGGTVSKGSVLSGGTLCLLSGASAVEAAVNGGFMDVFSSGIAENTVICSGGYVRVRDFGSAIGTLIESGASMYVHSSSGYAYDTLISGFGRVYDGATMSKVTIASGGSFHLWRGGILKDAEVRYGGVLDIRESSSILSGDVLIAGQLKISYDHKTDFSNADIVVDMSGRTVTDTYSIINLDYIGESAISIKVADNQARGTYKFASNASLFTDTITIGNGTKNFGTLTIGGSALKYGDYSYTLVRNGKNLNLTVTASQIPAPVVTADVTGPTNKDVTLTVAFDSLCTVRQYRINGGSWQSCSETVKVSQNCKLEFRCKDAQDVYSDITVYTVSNIDKTAPVLTVSGNTTVPARSVVLTAVSDDGTPVKYSFDNVNWNDYTSSVNVVKNGTVYFKATDLAGNTTLKSVAVSNIEESDLDIPLVTADVISPTNGNVKLTAIFDKSVVLREYRIDGGAWQNYTSGVTVSRNCKVEFRGKDKWDVYSDIAVYTVSNIDKISPVITVSGNTTVPARTVVLTAVSDDGSPVKYSFDNVNWNDYTSFVNVVKNGTVYFKSTDLAGNTALASVVVSNIDHSGFEAPVVTADITSPTNKVVTLEAVFSNDTARKQYSTDGRIWNFCPATLTVRENGTFYFRGIDAAGNISEVTVYTVSNIDKAPPEVPVTFEFTSAAAVDWNDTADTGIAGIAGYNIRYGKNASLSGSGTFVEESIFSVNSFEAGDWYFQVQSVDAAGNVSEWSQVYALTVAPGPKGLAGDADGVKWNAVSGESSYVVEYSTDDFATGLSVTTTACGLDTFALPEGNYQWRVRASGDQYWGCGEAVSGTAIEEITEYSSVANGVDDLFFANAKGVWDDGFAAQHQGDGLWGGTEEAVCLQGKNKLSDIFNGSSDTGTLVMTDDANGDVLFVEDIFTALGEQARFSGIDEIRAGAGDDIVDMTGQHYTYDGDNICIYGGSGNDTIWGGAQCNTLYGDAGNDRLVGASGDDFLIGGSENDSMHGGGGDDIFCFGADWGTDTVEQLENGSVTLYFAEGSAANWNAESRIYSDGVNSVTVRGCADVTVKFGTAEELPPGAFAPVSSEKIFS